MNLSSKLLLAVLVASASTDAVATTWSCQSSEELGIYPPLVVWDRNDGTAKGSLFQNPNTSGVLTRMIPHNGGVKANLEFHTSHGLDKGKIQELMIFAAGNEYRMAGAIYAVKDGKRYMDPILPAVTVKCASL